MWLENETKQKWRHTFIALGINLVAITIILWATYVFWNISPTSTDTLSRFKNSNPDFFYGWPYFHYFLRDDAFVYVAYEEAYARGPTWLLMNSKIKNRVLWSFIALILLSGIWANEHLFPWPVFMVGMIWGLLVIKTRSPWPAFVCHSMANIFIYFAIRTMLYFFPIT